MRTLLFKAMRILVITSIAASAMYTGLITLRSLNGSDSHPAPSQGQR